MMASTSDTLSITLKLGSQILPMTVRRDQEIYYREAEKLINQRFTYYADKYPRLSNELYLTMMALDVSVQLKSQEGEANLGEMAEVLQGLVTDVEECLSES